MEIGFIGLGMMGRAMARNLAGAGHDVRAWNRSPLPAGAGEGLRIVATPAEAFAADVVFTMLSDDAAIRAVLLDPGVVDGARTGTVHVVTSTISLAFVDELSARHAAAGVGYVAAPVLGRPDVAAAAQLNILAAGDPQAIATARPLLDVVGKRTFVLGEDPKQANAAKIATNMMIVMAIEAMAEAIVLTGGSGLAPEVFLDLVLQTQFGGSRAYETYSRKILAGDDEAGFKMHLGLKDLGLADVAGKATGRPLPMLAAAHARMAEAVGAGLGEKDWSGIAGYTIHRAA